MHHLALQVPDPPDSKVPDPPYYNGNVNLGFRSS
jgi:hypothetical protein